MLQKVDVEDDVQGEDRGYMLRPEFYLEILGRRWLFFVIPFVIVAPVGIAIAMLLPPVYLSEGKILVDSQQIPTELVRPTVTSAAQERIQVIEQRTMTRDNLVAIVEKFDLFPEKRRFMSASESVELMKKSTRILPVDQQLEFKQRSRQENPTIVFSVGFEYPNAQTATRVANELVTRILDEDLRDRTSRATDTTKFLAREVQKLQAESDAVEVKIVQAKIAQAKIAQIKGTQVDQPSALLGQLKAELAQKSAIYSAKHPILQSLKRQIETMEHADLGVVKDASPGLKDISPVAKEDAEAAASLEALEAQQETLQKNLDSASSRLAAARLGENLERNQQAEKLEVIEQPTTPQIPVRPNRPRVVELSVLLAAAAGAGLAILAELMDKAIRRSSDVFGVVDSRLVISIPYITTAAELHRRKRRVVWTIVILVAIVVSAMIGAYLLLPLDLMIAKAQVGLFR